MTRTHSGSLAAGGLNWDSLPLKLFAGGNAKFWNPADIDFSRDRADWERLNDDEHDFATRLCAQFIAGEEAVTEDIQPFMAAMREEGRLGDEMYLTQFAFEEAKHTQVFRLWLDAVGLTEDLHGYLDPLPAYRQMFYDELPDSLNALSSDASPAAQIRASVTYNHVVEGMLALTGYYAWHKICVERNILPGMQELVRRIGDDERRHMAWGTFTCRRRRRQLGRLRIADERVDAARSRRHRAGFCAVRRVAVRSGPGRVHAIRRRQGDAQVRHHQQCARSATCRDRPRLLAGATGGHLRCRRRKGPGGSLVSPPTRSWRCRTRGCRGPRVRGHSRIV